MIIANIDIAIDKTSVLIIITPMNKLEQPIFFSFSF